MVGRSVTKALLVPFHGIGMGCGGAFHAIPLMENDGVVPTAGSEN